MFGICIDPFSLETKNLSDCTGVAYESWVSNKSLAQWLSAEAEDWSGRSSFMAMGSKTFTDKIWAPISLIKDTSEWVVSRILLGCSLWFSWRTLTFPYQSHRLTSLSLLSPHTLFAWVFVMCDMLPNALCMGAVSRRPCCMWRYYGSLQTLQTSDR